MFSDEYRHEIELGKYTKWATNLIPEDLLGLLWALGEYGHRARTAVHREAFEKELLECAAKYQLHPRALVGLRMALQCASGEFHAVEEVKAAIRAAVDASRSEDGSK
jgi:hypothetical protein